MTLPLPTSLADITVLVDGKPAPLFFVSPTQINYQVPENTAFGTRGNVVPITALFKQSPLSIALKLTVFSCSFAAKPGPNCPAAACNVGFASLRFAVPVRSPANGATTIF